MLAIKEQLHDIVNKRKPDKSLKGWLEKRKGLFVAIAGFFATFFALFQPVTDYLANTGKREKVEFNEKMIALVNKFSDTSETIRERNLYLLSLNDAEAVIPFLLDDINREPNDDKRNTNNEISTKKIRNAIKDMWEKLSEPKGFKKLTNSITFTKSKKEVVGNIITNYSSRAFAEIKDYHEKEDEQQRISALIENYLKLVAELKLNKTNKDINNELDSLQVRISRILVNPDDATAKSVFNDQILYAKGEL